MSEDEDLKNGSPPEKGGGENGTGAEGEETEQKDIFDLGLEGRTSFKQHRKNVRHYIAHEEYGVLFSHCGMRITKNQVDYKPPKKDGELRCEKCKRHIWELVASEQYAKKIKEKKDLDD